MVASIKKTFSKYNLHTHSEFCDGVGSISEHCETAINNCFTILGFSSHAPLKFNNNFSLSSSKIEKYIEEIENAQIRHEGKLQILKGLECDYIGGLIEPFCFFKNKYHLDYIIGGIHLVGKDNPENLWFIDGPRQEIYDDGLKKIFNNDIKKGVQTYFNQMNEMIEKEEFDILAHIDKIKMHNQRRFFNENEKWYLNLINETLNLVKQKDIIIEINYRGIYKQRCTEFYPSYTILKMMNNKKIRICISSDAHQPLENGLLHAKALEFAKSVGYKETYCLNNAISI